MCNKPVVDPSEELEETKEHLYALATVCRIVPPTSVEDVALCATSLHRACAETDKEDDKFAHILQRHLCLPLLQDECWISALLCIQFIETELKRESMDSIWSRALAMIHGESALSYVLFLGHAAAFSKYACVSIFALLRHRLYEGTLKQIAPLLMILLKLLRTHLPKQINSQDSELLYHSCTCTGLWTEALKYYTQIRPPRPPLLGVLSPHNTTAVVQWAIKRRIPLPPKQLIECLREASFQQRISPAILSAILRKSDMLHLSEGQSISLPVSLPEYLSRGSWAAAFQSLHQVVCQGIALDSETLAMMVCLGIKTGHWDAALRVLKSFSDVASGIPSNWLSRIAALLFSGTHWRKGFRFLAKYAPFHASTTFWDILHSATSQQDWVVTLAAFRLVSASSSSSSSSSPSQILALCALDNTSRISSQSWMDDASHTAHGLGYDLLISSCTPTQWRQALATYTLMTHRNVTPHHRTLQTLVQQCLAGQRWQPAFALYSNLLNDCFHNHNNNKLKQQQQHPHVLLSLKQQLEIQYLLLREQQWRHHLWVYTHWRGLSSNLAGNLVIGGAAQGAQWGLALRLALHMRRKQFSFSMHAAGAVSYAFHLAQRPERYERVYGEATRMLGGG